MKHANEVYCAIWVPINVQPENFSKAILHDLTLLNLKKNYQ